MFWIGAAPTVPGISARFSSPAQPWPSVRMTKSCHSHAGVGAHDRASSPSSSTMRDAPGRSARAPRLSDSPANSRLLPPPSTSDGGRAKLAVGEQFRQRRRRRATSTSIGAVAATPKVLRDRSGASSDDADGVASCVDRRQCRGWALPCGGASPRRIRRPAPGRDRPGRCRTAPASRRPRSWSRRRRRTGCRPRRSSGSTRAGACAACAAPRSTGPSAARRTGRRLRRHARCPARRMRDDRGVGGDHAVDAASRRARAPRRRCRSSDRSGAIFTSIGTRLPCCARRALPAPRAACRPGGAAPVLPAVRAGRRCWARRC